MRMRAASLLGVFLLAGCGTSAPQAEMPARTWKYYKANPAEIEPMQKICREWSASNAPAVTEPAVVGTNCQAAGFAQSQLQLGQ